MHLTASLLRQFRWMVGKMPKPVKRIPGHQRLGKTRVEDPITRMAVRSMADRLFQEEETTKHLFNPYITKADEYYITQEKEANTKSKAEKEKLRKIWRNCPDNHIMYKTVLDHTLVAKKWRDD